jgi:hypothetical protein
MNDALPELPQRELDLNCPKSQPGDPKQLDSSYSKKLPEKIVSDSLGLKIDLQK